MKTHNTIAKDLKETDNRSVPPKTRFWSRSRDASKIFLLYSNCSTEIVFFGASKVGVLPYSKSALRRSREPAENIANRIF